MVQRVGGAAQQWQQRPVLPEQSKRCDAPVMYVSADGAGVPMVGRKGKHEQGKAKTR